jgi:acetolactate synthase-1/2/3 large subunit
MKASDYIVEFLISKKITDVFGIPGEIMLDFLDAINHKKDKISAHLNYHEQASAFAACGYAQVSGKPAVAYSTKGPGLTNMITAIADAFCDSIPVLFITAYSKTNATGARFECNQELDTIKMFSGIVKYAVRIDNPKDLLYELEYSYCQAISGRMGPVLIDIQADVLKSNIDINTLVSYKHENLPLDSCKSIIDYIKTSILAAKRPVLLIGDGIHQSNTQQYLNDFVENIKIPVLSSRFSQDALCNSKYYYGFIGSHGTRYGNFILSKCDLVISLGNRLSYNPFSKSFSNFVKQAKIIRIDIDTNEFDRKLPNSVNFHMDLKKLMPALVKNNWSDIVSSEWVNVCNVLRETLYDCDTLYPVNIISSIIKKTKSDTIIVSDVGNNEFWLSRAYAFASVKNRILFSKSFGALGCALPKSIGAYYFGKSKVLCFTGDQGIQMNIQELQHISHERIPIVIVIINNVSSGMIRSKQESQFGSRFVHTTLDSGYSFPDFAMIAKTFSLQYFVIRNENDIMTIDYFLNLKSPCIVEIVVDENIDILPKLPKNNLCQKFEPLLDEETFKYLDKL